MTKTWSEAFRAHIHRRFPDGGAQQEAAFALRKAPSQIHYWCNGSRPREETRREIQRWSKGQVRADLPATLGLDATGTEG